MVVPDLPAPFSLGLCFCFWDLFLLFLHLLTNTHPLCGRVSHSSNIQHQISYQISYLIFLHFPVLHVLTISSLSHQYFPSLAACDTLLEVLQSAHESLLTFCCL